MFTIVFICALLLNTCSRLFLNVLQSKYIAQHAHRVPIEFQQKISLESHQKAARYSLDKLRLDSWSIVYDASILIALTLLGGLQYINLILTLLIDNDFLRQIGLILCVTLLLSILGLPFSLWKQFKIETKYGFNRMTLGLFISDSLKGLIMFALLGLPLIAAIIGLMRQAGTFWWLWAWGLFIAFNLLMLWLYPTVIAPRFNKFKPLDNTELMEKIQALAQRCHFSLQGIFVMDGSKRSSHGNAYFTGFGKSKRIVFFDTLIERLSPNEIEAVLAHELGHFHHKHILKRIITSFALSLLFFFLLGWISQQAWFYTQLGVIPNLLGSNEALALILFFLVLPVFSFFFTPISSLFSRRDEFQADAYAVQHSHADELVQALLKLYDDNASTLTPHPFYSSVYDSHPPATQRIAHIKQLAQRSV